MPSVTSSSSARTANSGTSDTPSTSTTSRSRNAYHGPVEDRDGEYDVDSSVYCTDLMASTALGGGGGGGDGGDGRGGRYGDPLTGWSEGGGGRGTLGNGGNNDGSGGNKTGGGGGGGGLLGLLKRGKKKGTSASGKNKNKASGAAAIALAYNDFADDSSDEGQGGKEGGEGGESDLLHGGPSALQSIREDNDHDSFNDNDEENDDAGTVQTKTDVFLEYADSAQLDDGMMSTVAPDEEANGGAIGSDGRNDNRKDTLRAVVEEEDSTIKGSNGSSDSDTGSSVFLGGSLVSSLASGGVSRLGASHTPPPRVSTSHKQHPFQLHPSHVRQSGSAVPDWARDDDDSNDKDDSSTEECSDHHHRRHHRHGPTKPTKLAKYQRSQSAGSESTATRKRNRMLTMAAMTMLFLGLCAVVLGVAYGMGVMGGGGSGGKGKGMASGSGSGANGGSSQACAQTGSCGGGDAGDSVETADPALPPLDHAPIPTVPTDRPTSPPFDDTDGICAEHGAKSQSCGAHNPHHPARCCSGLYCKDKVCTDPNPTMKEGGEKKDDAKNNEKPPTAAPTSSETREPTVEPEPTSHPTSAAPTKPPTPNMWISQPTSELTAEGVVLPPGHFAYDPNDDVYGPQAWSDPRYASTTSVILDGKAVTDTARLAEMGSDELDGLEIVPGDEASAEYKFWSRHAWSIDPNRKTAITENVCGGFDARAEQSPIDVYVQSGDIDETGEETGIPGSVVQPRCFEHHEIRIKPGQFSLDNDKIRKEILPSQLRLTYPDPEFEADGKTLAADSKLPTADFPYGWGGNMEALRVDVKIPSEHWLNGKEYAAEYQLYHLHHKKKRAPVISIMMDIHPLDKPNEHFQLALDQWQAVWQKDYLECELRERKERRATATLMESIKSWISPTRSKQEELRQSTILDEPAEELEKLRRNLRAARKMQEETNFAWDPYKKDEIMRSIHFFAYSGSLTEPPCTEFVDWRILDTPMLISRRQLFQMKTLLFNHRSVESGCRPSSNHHMGSVARRPLQPLNRRKVYRCTCRDFLSDEDRDTILALDGLTEANATYTPRCSKREFRLAEKHREWLHRPEDEGMTPVGGTLLPDDPADGGL